MGLLKAEMNKVSAKKVTSLHRPLTYCNLQWDYLSVCTTNPIVPLSNNLAERMLRLGVLGRKNFQGSRTGRGARMAEVMYSIVNTCLLLDVHVANYIKAALLAAKDNQLLLPHHFAEAHCDDIA